MNMIRSCTIVHDWDVEIWDLFYYYNLVNVSTTNVSLFFFHFLRKGRLPIDLSFNNKLPDADEYWSYKDLVSSLAKTEHEAMKRTLKLIQNKHVKFDSVRTRS